MIPVLSTRNSTLPALTSCDGLGDVRRHGTRLRVGHQARAVRVFYRVYRPSASCPGVATTASKSIQPSDWILLTMSSPPTKSAPASASLALLVARRDHQHFLGLAEPVRHHDRAADHPVGMLWIHPEAHMDFDGLIELGELDLLKEGNRLIDGVFARLVFV